MYSIIPIDRWYYIKEQVIRGKLSHTFAPTHESSLRQFGSEFKIVSPADITTEKVRQWYDWMRFEKKSGLKESTGQGFIFGPRAFLGWLVDCEKLRENVALKLELDEFPGYRTGGGRSTSEMI